MTKFEKLVKEVGNDVFNDNLISVSEEIVLKAILKNKELSSFGRMTLIHQFEQNLISIGYLHDAGIR